MPRRNDQPEQVNGIGDAVVFLAQSSDTDLLKFLRRLPMVAGSEDGTITISDLIFEMMLWPYIQTAWTKVDGHPGIPGRLRQIADVYRLAEAELEKETGERRRTPRVISVPEFTKIYSGEGLP